MPDMREGGLGTAACYLTVERLALQAGVESPFWDEASLLMGGCEEPWYKKPLTPRRLRSFLKRYGGSLPDDAGRRGHAASVFSDVMRLHGIPMEDGAKAKRRERARRDFYRNASPRSFHPTKAFLDKWVREMYGWKNVKPSDVIIAKETCAEGIYYCVRKTVGNGDFFSVTSFGKR